MSSLFHSFAIVLISKEYIFICRHNIYLGLADQIAASSWIQAGRIDAHVSEGITAVAESCGSTGTRTLVVATPELVGVARLALHPSHRDVTTCSVDTAPAGSGSSGAGAVGLNIDVVGRTAPTGLVADGVDGDGNSPPGGLAILTDVEIWRGRSPEIARAPDLRGV